MNWVYICQRTLVKRSSIMASLKLNLIAACDSKMGIGRNNELPWRLRKEMAYFNRMTTGYSKEAGPASGHKRNVVVMGRKTWDSIPPAFRPLKNRLNVVLSRSSGPSEETSQEDDVLWTTSWDDMVDKLEKMDGNGEIGRIWITGGSYIYKLALDSPHCHRIYLTRIDNDYGCDVFFPNFKEADFQLVKDSEVPEGEQQESDVKYSIMVYEKV